MQPIKKFTEKHLAIFAAILFIFIISTQLIKPIIEKEQIKKNLTTVYAKQNIKIQNNNSTTFVRKLKLLEPVNIIKDETKEIWDVYDESFTKIGTINRRDIIFKDTPEYEQAEIRKNSQIQ